MQVTPLTSRCLNLLLVCLFMACSAANGRSGPPVSNPAPHHAAPAVTMTPRHFPDHTIEDVRDAFRLTKTLDDHTVFIYQLMEVGWPTGGSGSEKEQLAYIRRLPALLEQVNVSVVAWALLHDIELPAFDADLNSVGLITTGGQEKPGYREFEALKNRMR